MSNIVIAGDTSGSVTLQAPAVAGGTVVTLPATTGTAALTSDLLGVGQTWQNLTASRALGATHTNSSGKPISIIFRASSSSTTSITITAGGLTFPATTAVGGQSSVSFVVPTSSDYSIASTNTSSFVWLELR